MYTLQRTNKQMSVLDFFLYATNYNITITYYIEIICVSLQTTCEITEVGNYRESFNPNDVFIVDTGSVAYQVK